MQEKPLNTKPKSSKQNVFCLVHLIKTKTLHHKNIPSIFEYKKKRCFFFVVNLSLEYSFEGGKFSNVGLQGRPASALAELSAAALLYFPTASHFPRNTIFIISKHAGFSGLTLFTRRRNPNFPCGYRKPTLAPHWLGSPHHVQSWPTAHQGKVMCFNPGLYRRTTISNVWWKKK